MAFPSFGNLDPKSQLAKELWEWTAKQAKKELKEEEERQLIALQNPPVYPYQYGYNNSLGAGGLSVLQGSSALHQAQNAQQSAMLSLSPMMTQALYGSGVSTPTESSPSPAHKSLLAQIDKLKSAEPEKLSARRSPDYTATLTGWRGWAVNNEKLIALGMSGSWDPKKAKPAKCQSGSGNAHRAPAKDCSCGYWSFRDMDLLSKALSGYTSNVAVVGAVEIWGRVIECENGYRSEFAYPKELWLLKPDLEYLSEAYSVKVRRLEGQ